MPLIPPSVMPVNRVPAISALLRPMGSGYVVQDVRPAMLADAYPATAPMMWVSVTSVSPQPQPGDLTMDGGKTFTRPNMPPL